MEKYLITPVLVCFFLVGCSSEDGSHDHDHDHSLLEHDHSLLHDHNLVLEEEVGSVKTLEERFKLVKVGMTFEEVKSIMGFPDRLQYEVDRGKVPQDSLSIEWWYEYPWLDPNFPKRIGVYIIRFLTRDINLVHGKSVDFYNGRVDDI